MREGPALATLTTGKVAEHADRSGVYQGHLAGLGDEASLRSTIEAAVNLAILLARGGDPQEAIGLAAMKGRIEILKLLKGQP